jgi:hypothetical protein
MQHFGHHTGSKKFGGVFQSSLRMSEVVLPAPIPATKQLTTDNDFHDDELAELRRTLRQDVDKSRHSGFCPMLPSMLAQISNLVTKDPLLLVRRLFLCGALKIRNGYAIGTAILSQFLGTTKSTINNYLAILLWKPGRLDRDQLGEYGSLPDRVWNACFKHFHIRVVKTVKPASEILLRGLKKSRPLDQIKMKLARSSRLVRELKHKNSTLQNALSRIRTAIENPDEEEKHPTDELCELADA